MTTRKQMRRVLVRRARRAHKAEGGDTYRVWRDSHGGRWVSLTAYGRLCMDLRDYDRANGVRHG